MFYHFYIFTSRVHFDNNWTVDVSSNSCIIDIGWEKKTIKQRTNTKDHIENKKVYKNVDERRISWKMWNQFWLKMIHGQCPHHDSRQKNQHKILGKKKFTYTENQNNPPFPSITHILKLLALHNKLKPKSVMMVCASHLFV